MTKLKIGQTIKEIIRTINANFTELDNKKSVSYTTLFEGSAEIPSNSSGGYSTITLNADITQFDGVIVQREAAGDWQRIQAIEIGSIFKVLNCEADFSFMEGCNLYLCNLEVISGTQLKATNNVYSGVKTSAAARYNTSFDARPITKIIGIKLNA